MTRLNKQAMVKPIKDSIVTMADGNPGALQALIHLGDCVSDVDPGAWMGTLAMLINLDLADIHGAAINTLHKEICGGAPLHTLTVLRAIQLDFISGDVVRVAAEQKQRQTPEKTALRESIPSLLARVQERLPDFGHPKPRTPAKST